MKFTKSTSTAILIVFLISAFVRETSAQQLQLTKLWETDSTLKIPESVLYYAPDKVLYVSCIDGKSNEKDLKGSIARVSVDGKILQAEWAKNLNAPKGMGVFKGTLYVADLDEVVGIDLKSGKVSKRIPVTGAVFLNDITIDEAGTIYVSDSRTGKVHRIAGTTVTTYLDRKMGVNGLLWVDKELYLAVKDTLYKADTGMKLTVITTGMDESSDGIVKHGNDFIVSCWNGIIYAVKTDGTKSVLLDTREQKSNTADIGFDPVSKTLYVPTFMKNKVVAYKVAP